MIERNHYLEILKRKKENGMIKVITGIRRCGKSYLLFEIYHGYLNSIGVENSQIIELALDDDLNIRYRNPLELGKHIRELVADNGKMHYVFLDEIQKVESIKNPYLPDSAEKITFVDTLLGLAKLKNVDLYVTGSNSKMLSSDILTEFRGRGDEIRIRPLAYSEFYASYEGVNGNKANAWRDYYTYGGMPALSDMRTHKDKQTYLFNLFNKIYLDDIIARNEIKNEKSVLDDLLDIISSSVGSLTNPPKLAKAFESLKKTKVSPLTIERYLDFFIDAFIVSNAMRYNVKGKKYIGSPQKYYFEDIGLRNARLNFRQTEETHLMENMIYNELLYRGFSVDVGIVEYNYKDGDGKSKRKNLEIDFVAGNGSERYYIQSALNVSEEEKRIQETRPLAATKDFYKKIVVVKDNIVPWHDEKGILYIGIETFLLEGFGD